MTAGTGLGDCGQAARDGAGSAAARQQPGASTSGRGSGGTSSASGAAAAAAAAAAAEALGAGALSGGGLGGRLGQMMAAYEAYGAGGGWEAEAARRQSAEMRNLIRLHQELTELAADAERLTAAAAASASAGTPGGPRGRGAGGGRGGGRGGVGGISPREALAAEAALQRRSEDLAAQLAALLEPGARQRLKDPAARAVVRYMETQMVELEPTDPPACPDSAAGAGADDSSEAAAATAAAGAGAGSGSAAAAAAEGGSGGGALTVDGPGLGRLGQVLVAAANWEAYRAFMALYAGRHPELGLTLVMQAAGMSDGDEWWARLPDVPAQASSSGSSSSSGSGSSSSSSRPLEVDWERVEAVAALDADVLAFLTELEAAGGGSAAESVFMKWYFHPSLGPRIRSGALLDPGAAAGVVGGAGGAAGAAGGAGGGAGGGGAGLMDPSALLARLLGDAGVGSGGGLGSEAFPDMVREAMAEAVGKPQAGQGRRQAEGAGGAEGGPRGRGRAGPALPRRGRR